VVTEYYNFIDRQDYNAALNLFHPAIVYVRDGTPPVVGIAALRDFYLKRRIIDHGTHTLLALVASGTQVAVRGCFEGVLKSGESVAVAFADFHSFSDDRRIVRRDTYFRGRAI
jgi:ketosteroid isomerase-like protein